MFPSSERQAGHKEEEDLRDLQIKGAGGLRFRFEALRHVGNGRYDSRVRVAFGSKLPCTRHYLLLLQLGQVGALGLLGFTARIEFPVRTPSWAQSGP